MAPRLATFSRILLHRALVERDLETGFSAHLALKDMQLALDSGQNLGCLMAYTQQAVFRLRKTVEAGLGRILCRSRAAIEATIRLRHRLHWLGLEGDWA